MLIIISQRFILFFSASKRQIVHKSWRNIWGLRSDGRRYSGFRLSAIRRPAQECGSLGRGGHGDRDGIIVRDQRRDFKKCQRTRRQRKVNNII